MEPGVGILVKGILPKAKEIFGGMFSKDRIGDSIIAMRWAPIAMVLFAAILTTVCKMGVVASFITILGVWLATSMSAQCVGQSGVNPMEIFRHYRSSCSKGCYLYRTDRGFLCCCSCSGSLRLVGDV